MTRLAAHDWESHSAGLMLRRRVAPVDPTSLGKNGALAVDFAAEPVYKPRSGKAAPEAALNDGGLLQSCAAGAVIRHLSLTHQAVSP
jgi:hypothetical protein